MKRTEFDPTDIESIRLEFSCSLCEAENKSNFIPVPINKMQPIDSDGYIFNSIFHKCAVCPMDYEIRVCATKQDGYIEIEGLEEFSSIGIIVKTNQQTLS